MVRTARTLAEDLFETEEEEDKEEEESRGSTLDHSRHQQSGLGGGIRVEGELQIGSTPPLAGLGRGSHLLRPAWMTPM